MKEKKLSVCRHRKGRHRKANKFLRDSQTNIVSKTLFSILIFFFKKLSTSLQETKWQNFHYTHVHCLFQIEQGVVTNDSPEDTLTTLMSHTEPQSVRYHWRDSSESHLMELLL